MRIDGTEMEVGVRKSGVDKLCEDTLCTKQFGEHRTLVFEQPPNLGCRQLEVELDTIGRLEELPPEIHMVDLTATFDGIVQDFESGANHEDRIGLVLLTDRCPSNDEWKVEPMRRQRVTGAIDVDEQSETRWVGVFDLDVDGDIPRTMVGTRIELEFRYVIEL